MTSQNVRNFGIIGGATAAVLAGMLIGATPALSRKATSRDPLAKYVTIIAKNRIQCLTRNVA